MHLFVYLFMNFWKMIFFFFSETIFIFRKKVIISEYSDKLCFRENGAVHIMCQIIVKHLCDMTETQFV